MDVITAKFLDCLEGKRFLSYLFCLNVGFIDELHRTIKNAAPFGLFVDVGVGSDGLLHASELKKRGSGRPGLQPSPPGIWRYCFRVVPDQASAPWNSQKNVNFHPSCSP